MKVEKPKQKKRKTKTKIKKPYIKILNMGDYQANGLMDFLPKLLERFSQLKSGQNKRTDNTKRTC